MRSLLRPHWAAPLVIGCAVSIGCGDGAGGGSEPTQGGSLATSGGQAGGAAASGGAASGGVPTNGGSSSGASAGGGTPTGGASAGGTPSAGAATGTASTGGTIGAGGSDGGAAAGGSSGTTTGVVGQPIGFATLNGGTSGGKAGQTVTVSTFTDLKAYAEKSEPFVVLVRGHISNGPNGGQIRVKSNKSLVGLGADAFLDGIGIDISNANDIILQNLRVSLTGVTTRTETPGVYTASGDDGAPQVLVNGGDAISISGTSKNIWIDHCELFSENPSQQTNKDLYDGLVDIKGQTGFITVSFTYLHDHHKGGLVGASDSDLSADRKVTLHHNYYKDVLLRVPMYRGSVGHFFNNYIVGAKDATEIRADTCVRVERNYYESLNYSIYTPADAPGRTERIENIEVKRASRAYPVDCTADIPYSYSAALTQVTSDVKTTVPASAGVGKI